MILKMTLKNILKNMHIHPTVPQVIAAWQPSSPMSIPTSATWEAVWTELQFQGWTCQKSTATVGVGTAAGDATAGQILCFWQSQDPGMTFDKLQSYATLLVGPDPMQQPQHCGRK
jgi:hypothetical protein